MDNSPTSLQRGITPRTLNMLTFGSSIGTGIFLASGHALYLAGPGGVLVAYILFGICAYCLMKLLCDLATHMPSTGAFYVYAERYFNTSFAYALTWNYWYSLAINIAVEIFAAAILMQFWFPHSTTLFWFCLFISIISILNIISVRYFAETEFYISLIKLVAVIFFILIGSAVLLNLTYLPSPGLANWRIDHTPFHGGMSAILPVLIIAGFSYQGIEQTVICAGECHEPEKLIPNAIRFVFWRITLFFIVTLIIISLLLPHHSNRLASESTLTSPFTLVLTSLHVPFAASLMNFVILTAIISTANSNLYSATRMLWHLSKKNHLPNWVSKLNKHAMPQYALLITVCVTIICFIISLNSSSNSFLWLINSASFSGFIAWIGIAVCHYRYSHIKSPKQRSYASIAVIVICLITIASQYIPNASEAHKSLHDLVIQSFSIIIFITLWVGHRFLSKTYNNTHGSGSAVILPNKNDAETLQVEAGKIDY